MRGSQWPKRGLMGGVIRVCEIRCVRRLRLVLQRINQVALQPGPTRPDFCRLDQLAIGDRINTPVF